MESAQSPAPLLLVGLGNPGRRYANTRHNAGAIALHDFCEAEGFAPSKAGHGGQLRTTEHQGTRIDAFFPESFMNLSGLPVRQVSHFFRIPPERILVLQDELDLPVGTVRIKQGGGSGGHNGIKDLDRHIGANYWRIRLGIGRPPERVPTEAYVLQALEPEAMAHIQATAATLAQEKQALYALEMEALKKAFSAPKTTP